MKRFISAITVIAIAVSMMIPISVSAAANLLTDGGFEENEGLSTGNSWTFKGGSSPWYQYGGGALTEDNAAEGTKSVSFDKGVIGQRVHLESDKSYRLTAQVYSTAATTLKVGFHDGTKNYPNDNPVVREDITLGNKLF